MEIWIIWSSVLDLDDLSVPFQSGHSVILWFYVPFYRPSELTCEMTCTMIPCFFSYKPLHISSPVNHGRRESSIFFCCDPLCPLISSLRRTSVAPCVPADLNIYVLFAFLKILKENLPVNFHNLLLHKMHKYCRLLFKLGHCYYGSTQQFKLYI